MLVLDQKNQYSFSNMVVTIDDQTVINNAARAPRPELPKFNVLIPTVQDVGTTNVMEIFYPGEDAVYEAAHGKPNPLKYGFGPDIAMMILKKNAKVGVYHINLRGPSATMANTVLLLKYRVEEDVPYTDAEGNPYYRDANGQLTLEPTDATPVVRNVLHLKVVTTYVEDVKKWIDMLKALNNMYSEIEDDDGYKTMPLFAVMYRGASNYGNQVYFNLTSSRAAYDGNIYYIVDLFDGMNRKKTSPVYSLDLNSGAKYNTSYFIETLFNEEFPTLRCMTAETLPKLYELINQYMFTVDEHLSGATTPGEQFAALDIFAADRFMIQMDEGSIQVGMPGALQLAGGSDGSETPDQLYEMFFKGEILGDIKSTLRYRINYIPDINYNTATKQALMQLCRDRIRMSVGCIQIGGDDTFSSALVDHQANFFENWPEIRQLAKVQSPWMYNEYIRRTVVYPPVYFDLEALMDHFIANNNFFQPFAGASARWKGFIEDTMPYPTETPEYIGALQAARINVVQKDSEDGAYLSEQMMNTVLESDQTELNNAFLITCMLYDLLDLVHRNHYKFNETDEVRNFKIAVDTTINREYKPYSASLSVDVFRLGTVGRAKSANQITVRIDMKDINKFTDVNIILTDE